MTGRNDQKENRTHIRIEKQKKGEEEHLLMTEKMAARPIGEADSRSRECSPRDGDRLRESQLGSAAATTDRWACVSLSLALRG